MNSRSSLVMSIGVSGCSSSMICFAISRPMCVGCTCSIIQHSQGFV